MPLKSNSIRFDCLSSFRYVNCQFFIVLYAKIYDILCTVWFSVPKSNYFIAVVHNQIIAYKRCFFTVFFILRQNSVSISLLLNAYSLAQVSTPFAPPDTISVVFSGRYLFKFFTLILLEPITATFILKSPNTKNYMQAMHRL